jgi:hypothetical protein
MSTSNAMMTRGVAGCTTRAAASTTNSKRSQPYCFASSNVMVPAICVASDQSSGQLGWTADPKTVNARLTGSGTVLSTWYEFSSDRVELTGPSAVGITLCRVENRLWAKLIAKSFEFSAPRTNFPAFRLT